MRSFWIGLFTLIFVGQGSALADCDESGFIETTTPAPPYSSSAMSRHLLLAERVSGPSKFDSIIIGDSIVQLWADQLFKDATGSSTLLNLGVGTDRIQNTVWRLNSGRFDEVRAERVFVQVGTNNIGSDSPCAIQAGYIVLLEQIEHVFRPKQIVVLKILPRMDSPVLEERRRATNEALDALSRMFSDVKVISLQIDGADSYLPDGIHPSPNGYVFLSNDLRSKLR